MNIIHESTIISEKEIKDVIALLPKEYRDMDISIRIVDRIEQVYSRESDWQKRMKKLTKDNCGYYDPIHQRIIILVEEIKSEVEYYSKLLIKEEDKEYAENLSKIILEILKPAIAFVLTHEMQHAHQHLVQKKAVFNFFVALIHKKLVKYHDQWVEKDANRFGSEFCRKHQKKFKEIFNLKLPCSYLIDHNNWTVQLNFMINEKEVKIDIKNIA
jgi:hypothetical protein